MLFGFGVSVLFGHAEIDEVDLGGGVNAVEGVVENDGSWINRVGVNGSSGFVGSRYSSDEEIVGFDIAVNQVAFVNGLYPCDL